MSKKKSYMNNKNILSEGFFDIIKKYYHDISETMGTPSGIWRWILSFQIKNWYSRFQGKDV